MVTAMDYLPKECLVCVSESGRTAEALKGWLSQMKADVTSAMESGILCGPMAEAGYLHYEISNFARPGFFSKHNSSYWTGKKYLGLGPSAHSYNGIDREWNPSSLPI